MIWIALVGCRPDLPDGWEDAQPVDELTQGECSGTPYDTGVGSDVSADLGSDPLEVQATAVEFRCQQDVEGFWKQNGGGIDVLIQPIDMHPHDVAKCDCLYDLDVVVGSPSPAPDGVTVWRRWDDLNDPNPPVEVGRTPSTQTQITLGR